MSRRLPKDVKRARELTAQNLESEARMTQMIEQTVNAQMAHYQALEPIYLRESGLTKITQPDGSFTYEQTPEAKAMQDQAQQVQQLSQQRTLSALKGELPVSPGLERDIANSDRILKEALQKKMGSGYAESTPGAYRLAEQDARANELRESERRGEIAGANQLTLAAQNVRSNQVNYDPYGDNNAKKVNFAGSGSAAFANAGANAINSQGWYENYLQREAAQKAMKYGAKKNIQGALIGGGLQLGGQLAGAAAGYYGAR